MDDFDGPNGVHLREVPLYSQLLVCILYTSGDSRNEDRWVLGSYFLCYVFTVYVVNVRELTIALRWPTYNIITSYLQERRGVLAHPQPHRRIASVHDNVPTLYAPVSHESKPVFPAWWDVIETHSSTTLTIVIEILS